MIIEDLKAVIFNLFSGENLKNKIMKELENKIREALPRLQELTKGCIFTDRNNVIKYEVLGFSSDGKLTATYFNKFKISWNYNVDKFRVKFEVIGHPIKLNDVLEWLCKTKNHSCNMQDGNFYIFGHAWNLSSVFLADQSNELKEFLNDL